MVYIFIDLHAIHLTNGREKNITLLLFEREWKGKLNRQMWGRGVYGMILYYAVNNYWTTVSKCSLFLIWISFVYFADMKYFITGGAFHGNLKSLWNSKIIKITKPNNFSLSIYIGWDISNKINTKCSQKCNRAPFFFWSFKLCQKRTTVFDNFQWFAV